MMGSTQIASKCFKCGEPPDLQKIHTITGDKWSIECPSRCGCIIFFDYTIQGVFRKWNYEMIQKGSHGPDIRFRDDHTTR